MDLAKAISANKAGLAAVVAEIAALLALAGDAVLAPRLLHSEILRLLRPAEAALRRLIMMVAHGLTVATKPAGSKARRRVVRKRKAPQPGFVLFDPRKRLRTQVYASVAPRVTFFGGDAALVPQFQPQPTRAGSPGLISLQRLSQRLAALSAALGDIPRQAERLNRLKARRAASEKLRSLSPLRPGPPPGHARKPLHAIDRILAQCHWLAWELERGNTS